MPFLRLSMQRLRRCPASLAALLLLGVLGCREDRSPTGPMETASAEGSLATLSFRQVSVGEWHACGVTTDSLAYCWGLNRSGQLGAGTSTGPETCDLNSACSSRPLAVAGGLRFRSVSAGVDHTCGITTTDRLYCWGGGYLGNGTIGTATSPVAIGGTRRFRQVGAGQFHTCALDRADRVFCWGYNGWGQLGDGTTTERLSPAPVQAGALRFRRLATGDTHTCAITTGGRAYCWGHNTFGQIGDRTTTDRLLPVAVAGGLEFKDLDGGGFHTCANTPENQGYCWGRDLFGQAGDGNTWPRRLKPVKVVGGLALTRVSAGSSHTCGETSGDRAYCWGYNGFGELGNSTTTGPEVCVSQGCSSRPIPVAGGLSFTQVSAGGFSCGVAAGGVAYCWGNNRWGQLGDGSREDRLTPTSVDG